MYQIQKVDFFTFSSSYFTIYIGPPFFSNRFLCTFILQYYTSSCQGKLRSCHHVAIYFLKACAYGTE